MTEEDYKHNIEVLKERLEFYRKMNRKLQEENDSMKLKLEKVDKHMVKIKDATTLAESSYGEVIRAYEAELGKQQEINKDLHNRFRSFNKSLEDFQKTFVGKLFMYFFGRNNNEKRERLS